MQKIEIEKIGYDPQHYPRVNGEADWMTVNRYRASLVTHPWKSDPKREGAFPPVIVVKATGYEWPYILLDGLHRLKAFSAAGYKSIWAIVERLPQSKWIARSTELNIASKRPLDSGDKAWVASRLLHDGWNRAQVASLLEMETASFEKLMSTGVQKLSKSSVEKIKPGRSNRRINGDHYGFLKAPFRGVTGAANARTALTMQESVTSRDARQIIESFIAILESRCIDMTDEETAAMLRRAAGLLDELVSATST